MKKKLMKAARELSNKLHVTTSDFDKSNERLDEGFALIRPSREVHNSICETCDLKPDSVELVVMCLKSEFAKGKKHSMPHRHYGKSLTAVVPLTKGGTFLPTDRENILHLEKGECFIQGDKAHAFGMIDDRPFVAALAVANLEDNTAPIKQDNGDYRLSILEVSEYKGDTMRIVI